MEVRIVEFPETRVAVAEHHGSPELEHQTSKKLIAWRIQNGLTPDKHRTYGVHYTKPRPRALESVVQRNSPYSAGVSKPSAAAVTAVPLASSSVSSPITPAIVPAQSASSLPVDRPASAPLDVGADVLRAFIAGSKGAVRQLAEASGQTLDSPRPTKQEVFATAAAGAGVPDCLRPDALRQDPAHIGPIGLGGIFALTFLAHAAITGKCKP